VLSLRSTLCLALLCSPVFGSAQNVVAPDTLPFRRGQWAMQFGGGFSIATLGVLRFTSPKRAWLIDAALGGGHEHTTSHVTFPRDTVLSSFESNASISLRLGRRFYQGPGQKIVSFQTLGFLGGFSHNGGSSFGRASGETNGWSAGLFGELGAAFFVASKLSLGGTATATLTYTRSRTESSTGDRSTAWSYQGSAPAIRFVATIYF